MSAVARQARNIRTNGLTGREKESVYKSRWKILLAFGEGGRFKQYARFKSPLSYGCTRFVAAVRWRREGNFINCSLYLKCVTMLESCGLRGRCTCAKLHFNYLCNKECASNEMNLREASPSFSLDSRRSSYFILNPIWCGNLLRNLRLIIYENSNGYAVERSMWRFLLIAWDIFVHWCTLTRLNYWYFSRNENADEYKADSALS